MKIATERPTSIHTRNLIMNAEKAEVCQKKPEPYSADCLLHLTAVQAVIQATSYTQQQVLQVARDMLHDSHSKCCSNTRFSGCSDRLSCGAAIDAQSLWMKVESKFGQDSFAERDTEDKNGGATASSLDHVGPCRSGKPHVSVGQSSDVENMVPDSISVLLPDQESSQLPPAEMDQCPQPCTSASTVDTDQSVGLSPDGAFVHDPIAGDTKAAALPGDECQEASALTPASGGPVKETCPSPKLRELRRRMENLKRENARLKARQICRHCRCRPANLTLLPCGHLCLCAECGSSFDCCPVCHRTVLADVKTFLS